MDERPTLTNEQLDELLEGWLDKLEKYREKQLEKKIAKDPFIQQIDARLAKLSKRLKKNRARIIKGKESEYKTFMRNYDYSE